MMIFKEIKEAMQAATEALEKEIKLQMLTGYPLDTLIDLFAKGYTLMPPKTISEKSLREELKKLSKKGKKMDRYKEGYNDCNIEWKNKIEEVIKKHEKARKLARELIEEEVVIADSDSMNCGRIQAHDLILYDLQMLLKK